MNQWEWELLEAKQPVDDLRISGIALRPGSRVKLRPRPGGDVMDIALAGKDAIIESIEQDYEGKVHVCVVVDEDPGRDIGFMRQPGHRQKCPASSSPESAIFSLATMLSEWK
jgi:hypothetical protein